MKSDAARSPIRFAALAILGSWAVCASTMAAVREISQAEFSGQEHVITFNQFDWRTTGSLGNSLTIDGVEIEHLASTGYLGILQENVVNARFGDVPGASLGGALSDHTSTGTHLQLRFSSLPDPVYRVGFLLAGNYCTIGDCMGHKTFDLFIATYDPFNPNVTRTERLDVLLDTPNVRAEFVGLETTWQIDKLQIVETGTVGAGTDLDDVRFESVPEPAGLFILVGGALAIFATRNCRGRSGLGSIDRRV